MKVAVVRFPGSNCDLDAIAAVKSTRGLVPKLVWHEDNYIDSFDAVVLPGGFSFGDYLRAGAIAARSPAIDKIRRMAEAGKPVLGICNGFQILIEAGLLPGSLLRNVTLRFVCKWVRVRVENTRTPFTLLARGGDCLWIPIAHNEGRFYASRTETRELSRSGRVVFRYVDEQGLPTRRGNPTGTLDNIAGICNREGNVLGLMPHPERASDSLLSPFGTSDGRLVFSSLSFFGKEVGAAG